MSDKLPHVEVHEAMCKSIGDMAKENEALKARIKRLEEAGDGLLWYFCPKNTGDISFLQSEAIRQWNKAKETKP